MQRYIIKRLSPTLALERVALEAKTEAQHSKSTSLLFIIIVWQLESNYLELRVRS